MTKSATRMLPLVLRGLVGGMAAVGFGVLVLALVDPSDEPTTVTEPSTTTTLIERTTSSTSTTVEDLVTVPDLTGLDGFEAGRILRSLKLQRKLSYNSRPAVSDALRDGRVIAQSEPPGALVPAGTTVVLTIEVTRPASSSPTSVSAATTTTTTPTSTTRARQTTTTTTSTTTSTTTTTDPPTP